jgi:hypothetical protein
MITAKTLIAMLMSSNPFTAHLRKTFIVAEKFPQLISVPTSLPVCQGPFQGNFWLESGGMKFILRAAIIAPSRAALLRRQVFLGPTRQKHASSSLR